jgi:hypothetical protein
MQIATLRNAEDLSASRTKREELGASCLRRTIFLRYKGYEIAMRNEGNIEENALCWKMSFISGCQTPSQIRNAGTRLFLAASCKLFLIIP